MTRPKEKRRGGVFDDSVIYINYSREELIKLLMYGEKKVDSDDTEDRDYDEEED